ncbi:MAG: CDC27 family protein [Saprospiraceae bacterium]|nr:CDC27 family protein [Saprospiraceae bacterium]
MKGSFLIVTFCILVLSLANNILGQDNKFLQIDLSAGYTQSVQQFAKNLNYAGSGFNANVGFDYFFGRFGLGADGGYIQNQTTVKFQDFINTRFLENEKLSGTKPWESKYLVFGPVFKTTFGWLELDIFAKAGFTQTNVPDLLFSKTFFNQQFPVYRVNGDKDKWYGAWNAGARLNASISHLWGIQFKAGYFSTERLGTLNMLHTFRDASDSNNNGWIDDTEYFESGISERSETAVLSNFHLNAGVIFRIGKPKPTKIIQMIPEVVLNDVQTESDTSEILTTSADPVKDSDELISDDMVTITPDSATDPKIKIEETQKIPDRVELTDSNLNEISEPENDYTAPDYDELAATFLYKAGQSYFAANDFENAVACFNKLKADKNHPMAKYMFALSLAEMGNCEESYAEYRTFSAVYTGQDVGVLETVYASHLERCKKQKLPITKSESEDISEATPKQKSLNAIYDQENRKTAVATPPNKNKEELPLKKVNDSNTTNIPVKKEDNIIEGKSYRVQFIALKKADFTFPDLFEIGNIETEYFPTRSMYRYTLGPYTDPEVAVNAAKRTRKLGYRDAFVAEYIDGVRTNTLHHSR